MFMNNQIPSVVHQGRYEWPLDNPKRELNSGGGKFARVCLPRESVRRRVEYRRET